MEIIFISETNEIVQIPLVQNISEISCDIKDEEFETVNGTSLNLIGGKGLRSFSFTSFFPGKIYSFISLLKYRPPQEYIKFFEKYRDLRLPLRVIVVDKYQVVLNMLCRCNFSYQIRDRAGDVPYSLEVREYILPNQSGSGGNV